MDNYVYRNFTRESLGKAYDNSSAVENSSEILEGFNARSAEISKQFQDSMNLHYGLDSRERIDYFSCGKKDAHFSSLFMAGIGKCVARIPSVF